MLLLLAASCSQPPKLADDILDTGAWEPPDHVLATPVWQAADVEAALTAFAAAGLPVTGRARQAYLEIAAQGDDTCPGDIAHFSDETVPLSGCTSDEGASFAGVASLLQDEGIGGTVRSGFMLFGDFQVAGADGRRMNGGGHAHELVKQLDGELVVTTYLSGSWSLEQDASWMGDGFSGSVATEGHVVGDSFDVELIGSIGLRGQAIYTPSLRFDTTICASGQPLGSAAIRDPSGGWWALALDDDCSGCGELAWPDGTAHGPICPDLQPLGNSWKANALGLLQ